MLVSWVLFPLLLAAFCLGCGLLVEALCRKRLPGALLPVVGFAVVVVAGRFLTAADATAELTTPVVCALALAGAAIGVRRRRHLRSGWALGAAAAAFAAYAAPIVLSGEATFAGYIRLDDTATWMALTDRIMEHGRSLDGLAPSSYEATLAFNLGAGYPTGVFIPLGVGHVLTGRDVAWIIQPYMAFLGTLLALSLWELAAPLIRSRPLRAVVVVVGAQPALLYGYYLWGGVKEMGAAALVAGAAALLALAIRERFRPAVLTPLALVVAALIAVLSAGGIVWVIPGLLVALALAVRACGVRTALMRAAGLAGAIALLALPALLAGLTPPTSSPLTGSSALGNLVAPLELAQVAGIWPAGDFRLDPADPALAGVLIALAAVSAVGAAAWAWRRREPGPTLYAGGTLAAALAIVAVGSPWAGAKAMATASVVIPFAAALAGAVLWAAGRRLGGGLIMGAVIAGVVWSNALAYRDVNLAPSDQLAELERIGPSIAGEGPTLMTEYQPYGVRHFLRDADPEGVSELRRHRDALRNGETLPKGDFADTDRLDLHGLLRYRTLVLRRSPAQSRPPSPYRLTWRGDYYEVWQRPPRQPRRLEDHLGLDGGGRPVARPSCRRVRSLAREARGGRLLAARRQPSIVVNPASVAHPTAWAEARLHGRVVPETPGEIRAPVHVARAGEYELWLGGSVRPRVDAAVDGRDVGSVRHQLENDGLYTHLADVTLPAGESVVTLTFHGADLHPGSGGAPTPVGPLVLDPADAADERLTRVRPGDAGRLCGRRWDWIEAIG